MGPRAAPWRVTITTISRANASLHLPLLEYDVPTIIQRAKDVEQVHGRCVKDFHIHLAKRMHDDLLYAKRHKEETNWAKQQAQAHGKEARAKAKQQRPAIKDKKRAPDTHTVHHAKHGVVDTEAQGIANKSARPSR